MTEKKGLLDALKHMAFEDEPETATPHAPSAPPASIAAPPASAPASAPQSFAYSTPATYSSPIDMGVVPDNDELYQKLLAKTDFEGTDVAAAIHKYLEPLKAIPDSAMPPNIKFKTAVLQAKAQSGITEDAILGAFDTLSARLQQEHDAFADKAKQFVAREINGRQDHISQITTQITQLQQQLVQLSNDLLDAQGKSTHAQSQFTAAVQRRAGEIEQQKAQYAAMLKG